RLHSTGASTSEGTEGCVFLREQLQRNQGGRPTAAPGLQRALAFLVSLNKRPWGLYTNKVASVKTVMVLTHSQEWCRVFGVSGGFPADLRLVFPRFNIRKFPR
ncbi:unnamed protein product, partial [Ectocarpus sp. 13 AM-2016]